MATLEIEMTVRTRSWPMWLFVAISLLLNVSVLPLIEWIDFRNFEQQIQAVIFFAGAIVGEFCFVVLVAGLTKRTWLGAYLFGLGLAVCGYVAVLCGTWSINEFDRNVIAGLALLPAFLLVAASPLYGIRHCFGWRLTAEGESLPSRQPLLLADMFSLVAIVATVLVLVRVPLVISETDANEYWSQVVITNLVLFATALVVLPLHARSAFSNRSVAAKVVGLMSLAILIVASCFGIVQFFAYSFDTSWSTRLEVLPFLFTFLGAAIGMFHLSLLLLSASGMRLVRGHGLKQGPQTIDARRHATHLQRLTWRRIGAAVAITMGVSIYLANLQQWRAARDKENAMLLSRARAIDSEVRINDRIPFFLELGPKATDHDLEEFTTCNKLEYLYLKDSEITDRGLAHLRQFPLLHTLSLKNMSVSDDGLAHLRHLPNLETLEIENCEVKGSYIVGLPNKLRLKTLKLTRTQFGDDQCEGLVEFSALHSLTLDHTCITDRGFETIGRLKSLTNLELVGTEVQAERFPFLPALEHLDLSRTKVNDRSVSSIARLGQLQYLSLRDTKVTNVSIPSLARLKALYHIDLSDNLIDDDGIRVLGRDVPLVSIDLSCTRVTGSGFVGWRSNTRYHDVILDRTLVDDKGVAALISIGEVDDLSLARTKITDACLSHLAQIAIGELDIRGTQITFLGLVTNGLPSVGTLRVASGQFTPQQISQLKRQLRIGVKTGNP